MREITLQELQTLALNAQGEISKIYIHWTAGHYGQPFNDYHINIDKDGKMYTDMDSLTDYKPHTWRRNTGAIGISLMCAYGATSINNLGDEPPTETQLDKVAEVVAVLCVDIGLSCDIYNVLTHAEAAENMDGWYAHEPYGYYHNCERWDLLVVRAGDSPFSGGEWIRNKAKEYALSWGSTI